MLVRGLDYEGAVMDREGDFEGRAAVAGAVEEGAEGVREVGGVPVVNEATEDESVVGIVLAEKGAVEGRSCNQ